MDGSKLKELRQKNGYTREKLAKKLYVTEYILQGWEEGWSLISLSNGEMEELANAFQMTEEELRRVLSQEKDDDYSDDTKINFFDVIDSGIKWLELIRKMKE